MIFLKKKMGGTVRKNGGSYKGEVRQLKKSLDVL